MKEVHISYLLTCTLNAFPFLLDFFTIKLTLSAFERHLPAIHAVLNFILSLNSVMLLSLLAIEHAECINNKKLLAKSVFIKMKAMVCLGDFVTAFKVALWCKYLRPNVSRSNRHVL